MIIKDKVLIELDIPTVSGLIYPPTITPYMFENIIKKNIGGIIIEKNKKIEYNAKNNVFKVINPRCIVDRTEDVSVVLVICDVDIDETKVTKEQLKTLDTKSWRLAIAGDGELKKGTNIFEKFDLQFVNIEFVDETLYNIKE